MARVLNMATDPVYLEISKPEIETETSKETQPCS